MLLTYNTPIIVQIIIGTYVIIHRGHEILHFRNNNDCAAVSLTRDVNISDGYRLTSSTHPSPLHSYYYKNNESCKKYLKKKRTTCREEYDVLDCLR